jgi:hypothetical protein
VTVEEVVESYDTWLAGIDQRLTGSWESTMLNQISANLGADVARQELITLLEQGWELDEALKRLVIVASGLTPQEEE